MKGLLKNNYFAVRSNAKAFSVFMLLLGIFVVAVIPKCDCGFEERKLYKMEQI